MQGISIIICCYNSETRIKETLEALQAQEVPAGLQWEVVLVDNNSKDKTVEVSQAIWSKNNITTFRIVEETRPGQAYARKKGIQETKFDIISFIDDDNRVCTNWIALVDEIFKNHPECAACGGIGRAVFEKEEPFWFKKYQDNFAIGAQGKSTGYVDPLRSYLYGAGLSLQRKCYDTLMQSNFPEIQTGRLSKSLRGGGEDSELSFCLVILGYKLWYDERLKFDHYMPEARLSIQSLVELQKGFGRDEVILSIYRTHVCSFYKPIKSVLSIYIKSYIRLLIYNFKHRKLKNPEEILYLKIYNKSVHAYLDELLYYRKTFKTIKSKIDQFAELNKNKAIIGK